MGKISARLCVIAASTVMAAGLAASPASATVYNWTVDISIIGGGEISGGGQLTAGAATDGGYLVTAISGDYGAATITGLAPVGSYGGNDNLIFYPTTPYLNGYGIAFYVNKDPGAGEPNPVNIFYEDGGYTDNSQSTGAGSFTLSPTVPEPSTWAMMILGFAGLGYAGHRQATKARASLSPA